MKTEKHRYQAYIEISCPNVQKVDRQLTFEEAERIAELYNDSDVFNVIDSMENCKPLAKKYVSVNLTLQNWLRNNYSKSMKSNGKETNIDKLKGLNSIYKS